MMNGFGLLLAAVALGQSPARAAIVNSVTARDGRTLIETNGRHAPLTEALVLAGNIRVLTNALFRVGDGSPRRLEDGEILRNDGYLVKPDGRMHPVFDRIVKARAGVVMVHREGKSHRLTQRHPFPQGGYIDPDGMMVRPDGNLKRLIEGQMLRLDGSVLAAQDTVTLRDGVVYVQKEGDQFRLPRRRTIMMNDGTKVFGTGRLEFMDGSATTLAEGEVKILPGVAY